MNEGLKEGKNGALRKGEIVPGLQVMLYSNTKI